MGRGLDSRGLFADDRDREHFKELLGEVHERYRFVIHAWVQMDTHYHLLLQTPDANLSAGMQWFLLSYVNWFNTRQQRMGPLFQTRFKAVPVEDGAWSYEVSLYLHLNPLNIAELDLDKRNKAAERQGLRVPSAEEVAERLKRLRKYPWSSYPAYAGYRKAPDWLETDDLLKRACREKNRRRERYRGDVKHRLTKGVQAPRLEQLREDLAIGSASFLNRVRKLAGGGGRETTGKRRLRQRTSFADVVGVVEKVRGEAGEQFMSRRGDWGRPLVLHLARRFCGMTLREIGERAGGMDYAAVSVMLKRFALRVQKDRKLRSILNRASAMLNVETRHQ
jgi:REP element-mobilizing transposase RayT